MDNISRLKRCLSEIGLSKKLNDIEKNLKNICEAYKFEHATVLVTRTCSDGLNNPFALTTYPDQWVRKYKENEYVCVDPVVKASRSAFMPFDWESLEWDSAPATRFKREADAYGIGRLGLTIPVRGPQIERSLFTITTNASASAWHRKKSELAQELLVIGHHLHQKTMDLAQLRSEGKPAILSNREVQCFELLARGRLPKQIANDLSISERTVREYLASGRGKLGARNTSHAIARLVSLEVIEA